MRAHLVSHVFRRGVQHLARRQQYVDPLDQLRHDAEAYENAGPEFEVEPREILIIGMTFLVGILIMCSVSASPRLVLAFANQAIRSIIPSAKSWAHSP